MATNIASAGRKPFPKNPDEFLHDDRISYSQEDGGYLLVDEQNNEWEWNSQAGSWIIPPTEEEVAMFQRGYYNPADADENPDASTAQNVKKRKNEGKNHEGPQKKAAKAPENRAVFVSSLPLDVTIEELDEAFSRYGIIDQSTDGSKRIKLYTDEEGNFKGEALVVFFKRESIQIAIQMGDDYWFRPGDPRTISISEADPSFKRNNDGKDIKMPRRDKKASERNRAEMNRKLAEWSSDDEASKIIAPLPSKWNKNVIIKNAFTLKELEDDPAALSEIKEDMLSEAETFGEVTKVVLYDKEPEGIVLVRFKDAADAEAFKNKVHGRIFSNVSLQAHLAEQRPKFKKSSHEHESDDDEEEPPRTRSEELPTTAA